MLLYNTSETGEHPAANDAGSEEGDHSGSPSETKGGDVLRTKTQERLLAADLALFGALLLVAIWYPTSAIDGYGISYYLTHFDTFVPLAIGFVTCSVLSWRAASDLPDEGGLGVLRLALRIVAVLLVGIAFTPYTWGTLFDWTHQTLGSILFVEQLVMSGWIWWRYARTWFNALMIIGQIVGGVMALLSLPNDGIMVLFQGEVIFQLAFSILLFHSLSRLIPDDLEARIPLSERGPAHAARAHS
jgi:hypothetical protein